MAEYTQHFTCAPYVTPGELINRCSAASDFAEDDEELLEAIEDASTVVYYLTGRQFGGTCQATMRPGCYAGCECGCSVYQVNLGHWPVTELISVRSEGELLTGTGITDTFHVNNWRFIARNDGDPILPGNQWAVGGSTQDSADDGHVFEVTFDYGLAVPSLIKRATRALACEWMNQAGGGTGPCKLPERVTTVTRSGITLDVASAVDMLQNGRTGIYQVDLAIQTFNPSKLQSPSFVWSGQSTYNSRKIGT